MKRILERLLNRIARSVGIPEVQARIDELQREHLGHLNQARGENEALFKLAENQIRHQSEDNRHQIAQIELRTQQSLSDTQQSLSDTQQSLSDTQQSLSDTQQSQANFSSHLELRIDEVQLALTAATQQHTETLTAEIRSHLEKEISQVRRDLDNLRRSSPVGTSTEKKINIVIDSSPLIDDAMYVSLEDHFRGDPEVIKLRQMEYVSFVKDVVTATSPLLDLGSGRGEWLTILKNLDLPAQGIDSNSTCIAECLENGLDVIQGDLLSVLLTKKDKSFGAVTMFQVLEHLPFDVLILVLREIRRVLANGGVFIGEIPNSETLRVGASTFWIDPTHQRPIFPEVLRFLATKVGFSHVNSHYSNPVAPMPTWDGLSTENADSLRNMFHAINGPGDFAIIATA